MKKLSLILTAALMLAASFAHATVVRDGVKFRVVNDPGPATLGAPFELEIELAAASPVNLYDVRVLGTDWDDLVFTQPDMTWLEAGETARFTLRGVPRSADAVLEIVLGTDRGDLQRSVTVREWLPNKQRYRYELEDLPPELASQTPPAPSTTPFPTDTTPPPLMVELVDHPLYGQDPTDTDDAPRRDKDAKAYTLVVEGRVRYVRNDGALVGPYGAYARLYDEDSSWDEHLGTTRVDEYGYYRFEVTWDPCLVCDDSPDLYVEIESDSDHVRVQESGWLEREYFWVTPTRDDYDEHYLNMGDHYINHDEWGVAADILTTLERAYQWLHEEPGIGVQKIHVQWPSDECGGAAACYKDTFEEIHISHDRDWWRDTYVHEWGHHIMENWGCDIPADYCNDGGWCDNGGCGHCIWCSENENVALTEGFPNWMADRVLRYWDEQWWPHAPYNGRSQEAIVHCDTLPDGTKVWGDPERTEGHFGALLRDFEDADQDEHDYYPGSLGQRDRMSVGAKRVMKVMLGYDDGNQIFPDPSTPIQFLEMYLERFPVTHLPSFWATARNCGYELDDTPPLHPSNLDSPSHLVGVPSPNAYVDFTWDLDFDDLSGFAGYSWAVSTDAPVMPDETLDISLQTHLGVGPFDPGTYYFSIRSADYAGNWSPDYSSFGPIVIRDPTPVDLACSDAMGWDFPLVPRSDGTATQFDVSLSPTLPGDLVGTYWNFSGTNLGEEPVSGPTFTVGLRLDGETFQNWTQAAVGSHTTYVTLNAGPIHVHGGRHTFEIRHDADGQVAEENEHNNTWARQFVWTPAMLAPGAVVRNEGGLPDPVGGHEWIEDGVPVYPNCRGHAFAGGAGFDAVTLVTLDPVNDFDLGLYPASTGSEDGFTNPFALSTRGFGQTDIVFVNGNNMGARDWNVGVTYNSGLRGGTYDLKHVQSEPLSASGNKLVALEAGTYVDLTEVNFTATTGPVTVALWTDPATMDGLIRIGRLAPQMQYSSPNTIQDVHTLGMSGRVEFEIASPQPGNNCFVVYRDPQDSQAPLYLGLEIIPQEPNLAPATLTDWDGPVVPTRVPLTSGPAVLPSYLGGDTFFNWALANLSYNGTETGDGFYVRVNLDGNFVASRLVPDVHGGFVVFHFGETPHAVNAGRHSLTLKLDTRNDVAEYDETDNATGSQYVWRPGEMRKNDTLVRPEPPAMVGGWEDLESGAFYFNCDGVRTPVFDPVRDGAFAAVAILPPADADYDLRLHFPSSGPTHGFASSHATSAWGPGLSDYVLMDLEAARAYQFDVGVTKSLGFGQYIVQNATAVPIVPEPGQHRFGPFTLDQGEILALHEVDLPRGGYNVTLECASRADMGISFHTAGEGFQPKSDAQAAAWFAPPTEDETIYVNEYNTDRQCIVVWKRNSAADIGFVQYYLVIGDELSDAPATPSDRFALHPAVPNPFNPQTKLAFDLPATAEVRLHVYDVAGRRVRALLAGEARGPGRHEVVWDGRDDGGRAVAAGTYFYRLETPGFVQTRSMALVK